MDKLLAGTGAFDLWKQGKSAWNRWVQKPENKNCRIDFSECNFNNEDDTLVFTGFIFPGNTTFSRLTIGGRHLIFIDAIFLGDVYFTNMRISCPMINFRKAQFRGKSVSFVSTIFEGDGHIIFDDALFSHAAINFSGTTWGNRSIAFRNAIFEGGYFQASNVNFGSGTVDFSNSTIRDTCLDFVGGSMNTLIFEPSGQLTQAPDFRALHIEKGISIHGMRIAPLKHYTDDAIHKYRVLKRLAAQSHNHAQEIEFFAEEIRAKHYQVGDAILIRAYDWVSNFGRRIMRPFCLLMMQFLISALSYSLLGNQCWSAAFSLSTANTFPFASWSRTGKATAIEALYRDHWSGWVDFLGYAQGGISLVLLFLIGLAVRNRLRL